MYFPISLITSLVQIPNLLIQGVYENHSEYEFLKQKDREQNKSDSINFVSHFEGIENTKKTKESLKRTIIR